MDCVYSRLAPSIRFNFQAKQTREAGDPTQAEIGPGFDFFLKPLVRLKDITVLSAARNRMNESAFTIHLRQELRGLCSGWPHCEH